MDREIKYENILLLKPCFKGNLINIIQIFSNIFQWRFYDFKLRYKPLMNTNYVH